MSDTSFKSIPSRPTPHNLWDEIFKAIVNSMPSHLFPLIKEVFGKEYPKDTPVILLSPETSSFPENPGSSPSSSLMDAALLISGTDYYHLECQMHNDHEMVIRMFSYDLRFAITHTRDISNSGEIILRFPRSAVIYPDMNGAAPETLQCRIFFQDGSQHVYQVPAVQIQNYSLDEIHRKHLILFVPYLLLRFRPRLGPQCSNKLTEKELTNFIGQIILLLKEELSSGYLSEQEFHRYLYLFHLAADRILENEPYLHKEAVNMTECLIKFPDQIYEEQKAKLEAELEAYRNKLQAYKDEVQTYKGELQAYKGELQTYKGEVQTYKDEIQTYKDEVQTYKAENLIYKTENQKLRERILQLEKENPSS